MEITLDNGTVVDYNFPTWVNFVAQDEDKAICMFASKPTLIVEDDIGFLGRQLEYWNT